MAETERMQEGRRKGQRQTHAKVKSGCITWIRRVKCDETKPSCLKCTSTRRKCDGYRGKEPTRFFNTTTTFDGMRTTFKDFNADGTDGGQSTIISLELRMSPQNPLLDFSGTSQEHRSLDFFRHQAAPALSGYFDSDFWNVMLPRIGASEPPVQHAMIALASLCEQCRDGNEFPTVAQQAFALQQYNKAIRSLKVRSSEESTSEITLLTCVLFVCLELLRGNPEKALDHIESGLKILGASRQDDVPSPFVSESTSKTHDSDSVEEVLVRIFSRLSIQASLCGRRLPQVYPTDGSLSTSPQDMYSAPFSSIQEARESLNNLFVQSLQPQEPHAQFDPYLEIGDVLQSQRNHLIAQLHTWNARLALHITDSLPHLRQTEIQGSRVLRILSIIAIIWNSTTHIPEESAYDNYLVEYTTLISLASSFVAESAPSSPDSIATLSSTSAPTPTSSPTTPPNHSSFHNFTFEMGIIPALYFTAIKCRHPILRRNAIALLLEVRPRREGLWDARLLAHISQRLVEVEEEGACRVPESWPADERRVHGVYITPNYSLGARRSQEVQFTWRPDGPRGEWKQWVEDVAY